MLPNFFVIGAAKCGTTSLAHYLAHHPEIHMSPIKETRFFTAPDPNRPFAGLRVSTLAEYETLFETGLPIRGEASPNYSQHPWRLGVPERIHALVPDARLVYLVGDPIKRVLSHYTQALASHGETRTFEEAVGDLHAVDNLYTCPGRYAMQLERYLDVFSEGQILVVDQDQLLESRRDALDRVFGFLGVDRTHWAPEYDAVHNRSAGRRRLTSGMYGRVRKSALGRRIRRLPPSIRGPLVRPARRVLAREIHRPQLEPATRERLVEIYRPDVERLREMTGQPFGGWSL